MSLRRWLICGCVCWLVAGGESRAAGPDAVTTASEVNRLLKSEIVGTGQNDAVFAKQTNDETFLRRVSLDLVGEAPTPEEIVLFSLDSRADKRDREVQRLLRDDRYGENMARYWKDVILYRRTEDRALAATDVATRYLTDEFNKNTSWDKIATSFITATGDVSENGDTALIFAQAGDPEDTVSEISRIFLGIQIQCAQCHDHPTDRWKRDQFHHLAAFFPRVAVRPDIQNMRGFTVAVNDMPFSFRGMGNANQRFRGTPEHYMPDKDNPAAKGTLMEPMFFLTGQKLKTGTKDADRRGMLADWVTSPKNEWFAKAFVNRVWSELVGEGFYEPVDDIGPDRQCSAPKTLEHLANGFVDTGYDIKWLYRTITATDAYQRESRGRRTPDATPFLANVSQRLRGDQLFNNLMDLLGIDERPATPFRAGGGGPMGLRRSPRMLFNVVFGFDPSTPREEVAGSIPQALVLMNAPQINGSISAQYGLLRRLLAEVKQDDQLIAELYLKALSREPSDKELNTCKDYIRQVGNRAEATEDILWSLINSTEFTHRK